MFRIQSQAHVLYQENKQLKEQYNNLVQHANQLQIPPAPSLGKWVGKSDNGRQISGNSNWQYPQVRWMWIMSEYTDPADQ